MAHGRRGVLVNMVSASCKGQWGKIPPGSDKEPGPEPVISKQPNKSCIAQPTQEQEEQRLSSDAA